MNETLSGIKHPAFRDALALTRAGGRAATGRYLVEDADLVRQALSSPAVLHAVFATPEESPTLAAPCRERGTPLYIASAGLLTKLVGTGYETAVTAIAVVSQNLVPVETLLRSSEALILCGERIQDPRNVGVLIRTAEAVGCDGLLLSADSSEPFSRQAVRSTTGSILRLPIALVENLPETLRAARTAGATVVASSGQAERDVFSADLAVRPLILVVGNEQGGITDALLAAADVTVRLPMKPNGADSLNVTVAAGVLLYETIRQKLSVPPKTGRNPGLSAGT
ncbi:MAG: RNA methyltransferase [Capsulimonadales bacterium]|nr:RNA methyltransferase [Capsulimonadales bacterium]